MGQLTGSLGGKKVLKLSCKKVIKVLKLEICLS